MITRLQQAAARKQASELIAQAGLAIRPAELEQMEVADFGLSELEQSGAQIITLVDTDQVAVKVLVMFPRQTEPEHTHVPIGSYAGKQEIIRCEWGELYLYTPGEATAAPRAGPPAHRRDSYTARREIILRPGDQVTLPPNTPHWFQGGPEGAVIWSFSSKAVDNKDEFTDRDVRRQTVVI